jgi:Cu/Ag efflux protein CusF
LNTAFRKSFAHGPSTSVALIAIALLVASCQKSPPTENTNHTERPAPTQVIATGPPGFPPPVMDKPYPATGVVALINKKEGWIEINHDEIKDLMPAMQMEFWVKDRSLLDRVKAGDRVDFIVVETKKGEYLTEIKRSSSTATPSAK